MGHTAVRLQILIKVVIAIQKLLLITDNNNNESTKYLWQCFESSLSNKVADVTGKSLIHK